MPSLAVELEKSIEEERYFPLEKRKCAAKTVPVGGGRTADDLIPWASFAEEAVDFWQGVRPRLEVVRVASHVYPRRTYPLTGRMQIRDESEVRGACFASIFCIVNDAAAQLGWNICINATSSSSCAKCHADVAAFMLSRSDESSSSNENDDALSEDANQTAVETAVALPIEIKGPWQFCCKDWQFIGDALESGSAVKGMKRCLSQVYYYIIAEEVQYGVLCSKEEHIFFKRSSDPADKTLYASKVIKASDIAPSVRQCYLYILSKAKDGDTVNASQVPITQPSQKWTKIHREVFPVSPLGRQTSITGGALISGGIGSRAQVGRRHSNLQLNQNCLIQHADMNVQWLHGLMDVEVQCLTLGQVLKNGSKCIVRAGKVHGIDVCIKLYEFFDSYDWLCYFKAEVDAYEMLWPLQGSDVPVLVSYGTLWDHCVGFLATKTEGPSLSMKDASRQGLLKDVTAAFSRVHDCNVLHNDVDADNIVESSPKNAHHPYKIIDFGNSILWPQRREVESEGKEVISLIESYMYDRKATKKREA